MTDAYRLRRWQVGTTVAILVLAVMGTTLGLFREGFYQDPYALQVQGYGQDIVTLGVIVPLLAIGLWFATRGSLRGYFLWLGSLGYMAYSYLVYAVITEFNPFFLGYVALFGLSVYTFVAGLLQIDAETVKRRLEARIPVRLIVWFFVALGALVALLWLSEAVPATITNTKPPSIAEVDRPANVVHVLDLAVLVPAMFITARWLRQGRAWGYVLPGVLFVKVITIGLAVLGMIVWMMIHGQPVEPVLIVVFPLITLASIAVGLVYLRAIEASTFEDESGQPTSSH